MPLTSIRRNSLRNRTINIHTHTHSLHAPRAFTPSARHRSPQRRRSSPIRRRSSLDSRNSHTRKPSDTSLASGWRSGSVYSSPGVDTFPVRVSDWTTENVAAFMRGLGKGNCWNNYADTCLEVDIDGSTMLDATAGTPEAKSPNFIGRIQAKYRCSGQFCCPRRSVGILQELGFHKIHANKVIATLQKRQNLGEISTNNTNSAFERLEYVHVQSSGTHIPKSPSSVSGRCSAGGKNHLILYSGSNLSTERA